jgi:hypothetical protein
MKDKKYHVLAGALVAAFVGLPCYLESLSLFAGLWAALAGALVAACVKEYCDTGYCIDPTRWDWKDIGFTLIGAVLVALLIIGLPYGRG